MRLKIRHQTQYRFQQPASAITQTLRLSPRGYDGQHVASWRIDIDHNCRLRTAEDAFGNQTHIFSVEGPIHDLTVVVEGEVDTQDTGGVIRGAVERFPPEMYLRETDLTAPDLEIADFAEKAAAAEPTTLGKLHALMAAIHEKMTFESGPTDSATTAAQSFKMERGVCQDLTHVFLASARRLGVPARYVGGYLKRDEEPAAMNQEMEGMSQSLSVDPTPEQTAGHAWAEAFVPDLGWVGFDAANCVCPAESYVRVAIGLDYLGAAPVRGSRYGGVGESLDVKLWVGPLREKRGRRRT